MTQQPPQPGPVQLPPVPPSPDRLTAEQTLARLGYAPAPAPAQGWPTMPPAPAMPPPKRIDWRRLGWPGAHPLGVSARLIGLLVYVGSHIGVTAVIIGFVAALIPVPVLVG